MFYDDNVASSVLERPSMRPPKRIDNPEFDAIKSEMNKFTKSFEDPISGYAAYFAGSTIEGAKLRGLK